MRIVIQRENGIRAEAVLLAVNRNQMRVAVAGSSDTEQWAMLGGIWRDESGRRIEVEALLVVDGIDPSRFCGEVRPRTAAMGGAYA